MSGRQHSDERSSGSSNGGDDTRPEISLVEEFLSKTSGNSGVTGYNSLLRNSKEEKERQNEVISTTTLHHEQQQQHQQQQHNQFDADTGGESSASDRTSRGGLDSGLDCSYSVDVTPKRSIGACFIDASTLYDEAEFSSFPISESPYRSSTTSTSSSQPRSVDSSRQEIEKRQGYLVFKNSIHQYSGHPITSLSDSTNKSLEDVDDSFEIVDYPEPNQTPMNSLAFVPDDQGRIEEPAPIFMVQSLRKKPKHDESAPILSGATPISADFIKKPITDSPASRRRTEMCPILSGGSVDVEPEIERKPKKRSSSVTSASWTIDVNDLKGSKDSNTLKYPRDTSSPRPSLNYYVSLEEKREEQFDTNPKSLQITKSTGFFIDLSDDKPSSSLPGIKDKESALELKEEKKVEDKKNIFSMFIDFTEPKKPKPAPRLSSSYSSKNIGFGLAESKEDKKSDSTNTAIESTIDNKTIDKELKRPSGFGEKIPTVPPIAVKQESLISEQTPSPGEHHSNTSDSVVSHDEPQKRRINETFDKSSAGSLTDGILSKDLSPLSTTDEATYQRDSDGSFVPKKSDSSSNPLVKSNEDKSEMQSAMDSLTATAEKQKQLLLESPVIDGDKLLGTLTAEDANFGAEVNCQPRTEFVKLSDLDKQPRTKYDLKDFEFQKKMSTSADQAPKRDFWSDRWRQHDSLNVDTETSMINLLASCAENSRSLSRLFPHLNDVLSKSLPNDVDLSSYRNSNYLSDIAQSDISNTTSSSVTSGLESPDESSISCRQPRRLGEDLLKMFLQEIATDVVVEVGNRRMRAHKCILRSRCQYFAAILAGNWVQTAGNVITLPNYSYEAVWFALCHIYSGASYPPQGISLMELASLSDLLGLEGLKEVTTYALKINYCHNFHKPCSGCIEGVMQVFPVTLNHGLDDLYRKCLKWTCKYYTKVWPTRSFALLPTDLIYRCRQQILAHMVRYLFFFPNILHSLPFNVINRALNQC